MAPTKTDLDSVIQEVRSAESHLRGADAESWATRLDRDHDRIEQALDWLLKNDPTSGLELALALPDYWHLRGRWAEGRDWLERFLTAISAPTPTLRCRAVSSISGLAFRLGENEKARQFGNEALEIARRLGDKPLIVGALTRLARVGLRDNNPRQTMILCREALALAEEAGDEELSLSPLHCLAEATRMDGDYDGARQLYHRSLDLNRKRGDELVIGVETSNLGAVELRFGNIDRNPPLAGVLRPRPSNRKPLPAAVPRRRAGRSGCRQRRLGPGGPSPGRGKWTLQNQRGRNGSS